MRLHKTGHYIADTVSDLIGQYLIHSYLYYRLSAPVISDGEFDSLCDRINKVWTDIESPYKMFLISKGDEPPIKGLEVFDYPEEIVRTAHEIIQNGSLHS